MDEQKIKDFFEKLSNLPELQREFVFGIAEGISLMNKNQILNAKTESG